MAQARVLAMRTARDEPGDYGSEYQEVRMVFERVGQEEDEDYFYVRLSYQPVSDFQGEPGVEEFVIDKTGTVEFRQIIGRRQWCRKPSLKSGFGYTPLHCPLHSPHADVAIDDHRRHVR